jgi:hypothetical protein
LALGVAAGAEVFPAAGVAAAGVAAAERADNLFRAAAPAG